MMPALSKRGGLSIIWCKAANASWHGFAGRGCSGACGASQAAAGRSCLRSLSLDIFNAEVPKRGEAGPSLGDHRERAGKSDYGGTRPAGPLRRAYSARAARAASPPAR
jgi:hypothetical protein